MSVTSPMVYLRSSGRLIGCYVYVMLCNDPEWVYAKIGMSNDPIQRLRSIKNSSALIPEVLAVVHVPGREMAANLERSLHESLHQWRQNGEWFRFDPSDKQAFNDISKRVLADYSKPSLQLKWLKMTTKAIYHDAATRKRYWRHKHNTLGRAYRDACAEGLLSS